MGKDVAVGVRVETDKVAPLLGRIDIVGHDLAVGHLRKALKDLDRGGAGTLGDVEMIDVGGANKGELGGTDPSPEDNLFVELGGHQLLSSAQIENLKMTRMN